MAPTGKRKEKEPFPIWLAGVIGAIFLLLMFVGMNRNTSPAAPGGRALPNVTNATGNATADGTEGEIAFFTNETALSSSENLTYNETDGLAVNNAASFTSFNSSNHSIVTGFLKVGNEEWYANDVFGITDGFGGGLLMDGYDDGYGRGASMLSSRRNTALQPFFIFSGYDLDNPWEASGAQRQIWFGSFGTNQPDATDMIFTTSENYSWENPQNTGHASMTMARMYMGKMWIGTHYYLPSYTMDGSIPLYKLDVGDGDVRIRGASALGFGGDESSAYSSSLWDDGNFFHIASPNHIYMGNYIDTASGINLQGAYYNNIIRWWDTTNNDGYDVSLYRLDDSTLMVEADNMNVTGNITASNYTAGTSAGITKTITVANATGTCSITITGGIITGTTC